MSVLALRERDDDHRRQQALMQTRDAVTAAVSTKVSAHAIGSAAIEDAVDEALAQLLEAGTTGAELEGVKALWILTATRRAIDERRGAELRHRAAIAPDEQATADTISDGVHVASGACLRDEWRVREILGVLRGDQRRWAEAWWAAIVTREMSPGAQPRGLAQTLGWSSDKTEKTAQRARRTMQAFVRQRLRGEICAQQRAELDRYVATGEDRGGADAQRHEAMILHVAACEDCWARWQARRARANGRVAVIFVVGFGEIGSAASAVYARAARLAGELLGLRLRLGVGGGAAMTAGGGAAAVGGKGAAALCTAAVCAAAGGVALDAGLPTVLHDDAPRPSARPAQTTRTPATGAARQPAAKQAVRASQTRAGKVTTTPAQTPPAAPPPPVSPGDIPAATTPAQHTAARQTTSRARTPTTGEAPGDIPDAAPKRTAGASASSQSGATTAAKTTCTPGDIAC